MTKIILGLSLLLAMFLAPAQVYAINAPGLNGPINDSFVSNSTLSWQAMSDISPQDPYRVNVSSTADFAVLKKDYSTSNTSYKPTLEIGHWYWRVKVKDTSGNWSDWSATASFIITEATPTPAATSTPTASSTPEPSSTIIPTPTPNSSPSTMPTNTPSPTPTPSPISAKLTYTNLSASINSNQSLNINIQMIGMTPNSQYFIKPAFYKTGSTNYFGKTLVNNNWIKNSASYSEHYSLTTDSQGQWQGQISVMVDSDDSGFSTSGDYLFKIGRYNATGSGPTWSNESSIYITLVTTAAATPSPTPTTSPNPTIIPLGGILAATDSSNNINEGSSSADIDPALVDLPLISQGYILGEATESGDLVLATKEFKWNWYIIGGVVSLIAAISYLLYQRYKLSIIYAISQLRSYFDSENRSGL